MMRVIVSFGFLALFGGKKIAMRRFDPTFAGPKRRVSAYTDYVGKIEERQDVST